MGMERIGGIGGVGGRRGIGARGRAAALLLALGLSLPGCFTVGKDFPVEPVAQLEIGTTTRADVRRLFGDPWRVGVEDGDPLVDVAENEFVAAEGVEQVRRDVGGREYGRVLAVPQTPGDLGGVGGNRFHVGRGQRAVKRPGWRADQQ